MSEYQLGRYEIIEEIGSGGFATVFRARDTVLQREVAVKIMRPLLMSDAGFVARFEREAQVAANLEHPHIIPVYDYGEENGRLYLVMKWVRQGSLEKRLESGPLSFEEALAISRQIATALDYAHQRQIIHRDIKPDNVLLGNNDHVYLADFGLVKALQQSSLTASLSGGVLGTPAYVAPEIWHGQTALPQTDVYALACLLFEMVSGHPLFNAPTPPATMLLHFQEPKFPDEWPVAVPSGLTNTLRWALSQDPFERHSSAGELVEALGKLTNLPDENDPLAKTYTALEINVQRGEWDEAIKQAESILSHDPGYRNIQSLLDQALAGKARAGQSIWIAHWQEQAQKNVQAQKWDIALTAVERWLNLTPDNTEALALQQVIEANKNESSEVPGRAVNQQEDSAHFNLPHLVQGDVPLAFMWCWVPAGEFTLGSGDRLEERPATRLWLEQFWLARYPTTLGQYRQFVAGGGYDEKQWWLDAGWEWRCRHKIISPSNWEEQERRGKHYPVVGVNWYEAMAFCRWASTVQEQEIKLPSEAQWEKAARGTDRRKYPWGDDWDSTLCTVFIPKRANPTPVNKYDQRSESPYGCLDMSGNVWEWCSTVYGPYPIPATKERENLTDDERRVLRGGAWHGNALSVVVTRRHAKYPTNRNAASGFRCLVNRLTNKEHG